MNLPSHQAWYCYVILCFVLLAVWRVQSGSAFNPPATVSSAFTAASQLNSIAKYGVIRSSQRGSYRRCAAACLKEVDCKYFSYNQNTTQCELCNDTIVSTNENKMKYFRKSGHLCSEEGPLGMEDSRIPDESITASSMWEHQATAGPVRARLCTEGLSEGWVKLDSDTIPWIQVDFNGIVTITSLITQGRGDFDQWVTEYSVTYSDDSQSWNHVIDAHGTPIRFPGNEDRNTLVTTRFPVALRTRILRIHPTDWEWYCSMRFEVIGCY